MSTEQTTEEPRTEMVEFLEDALGFRLFPWQLEMIRRFEQEQECNRMDQEDEAEWQASQSAEAEARSIAEQDSPNIMFLRGAIANLQPWQQESILSYYRHREQEEAAAQAEEAAYIDEQSDRQDEANIAALIGGDGQGRTSRRGSWYQFGPFEPLVVTGPVDRWEEEPGRHYPRTRAQQEAIDQIEAERVPIRIMRADDPAAPKIQGLRERDGSFEFTITNYPDGPQGIFREWSIEEPSGERAHLGRGQVTDITTGQDQTA